MAIAFGNYCPSCYRGAGTLTPAVKIYLQFATSLLLVVGFSSCDGPDPKQITFLVKEGLPCAQADVTIAYRENTLLRFKSDDRGVVNLQDNSWEFQGMMIKYSAFKLSCYFEDHPAPPIIILLPQIQSTRVLEQDQIQLKFVDRHNKAAAGLEVLVNHTYAEKGLTLRSDDYGCIFIDSKTNPSLNFIMFKRANAYGEINVIINLSDEKKDSQLTITLPEVSKGQQK